MSIGEIAVKFRRKQGFIACMYAEGGRREGYIIGNEKRFVQVEICEPCGFAIRQGFRPAVQAEESA